MHGHLVSRHTPSVSGYRAAMTSVSVPVSQHTLTVNGVDFAYLAAGDNGPLALCLHGFPDSAHTWRHLLPLLAQAGYRAVAPFLRGYAPSGVPDDGRYDVGVLAVDAIEFHRALGGDEPGVIIGHDWGAPIAHGAANYAPERWAKVVTMAVPPGGALTVALATNLTQLKRSWYFFFFLHELSNIVVPADDLAFVDLLWSDWSPGFDAANEVPNVKNSLRDPANLSAALGYYRAALGTGLIDAALEDVRAAAGRVPVQPMLYLHGTNDGCVGSEVAESARSTVTANVTIDILDDCGHFLQLERPDIVNSRILDFLA
jgi:pimeloyl-ACP methyl ester carboxylesterase